MARTLDDPRIQALDDLADDLNEALGGSHFVPFLNLTEDKLQAEIDFEGPWSVDVPSADRAALESHIGGLWKQLQEADILAWE